MPYVTSRDGTPIAYDRVGQGPPLILVAGALSDRRFSKLVQLADLLSDDFTVVNYDRRGRGDSGDSAPYAMEREFEDLQAVIDAVGGSAAVWGWSSGAVLAARAAAAGVAIDDLVLYEPPFLVDDSRTPPPADLLAQLTRVVGEGRRSDAIKLFFVKGMGLPAVVPAAMRLTPMWRRLKRVAHTIPYDWTLLGDDHLGRPLNADDWAPVTARTLVVSGSKSPTQLRNAARALAAVLPNGEHRELPGQSHNPSTKALAAVLIERLTGAGGHVPRPAASARPAAALKAAFGRFGLPDRLH